VGVPAVTLTAGIGVTTGVVSSPGVLLSHVFAVSLFGHRLLKADRLAGGCSHRRPCALQGRKPQQQGEQQAKQFFNGSSHVLG
jgi:hypothetical protein